MAGNCTNVQVGTSGHLSDNPAYQDLATYAPHRRVCMLSLGVNSPPKNPSEEINYCAKSAVLDCHRENH